MAIDSDPKTRNEVLIYIKKIWKQSDEYAYIAALVVLVGVPSIITTLRWLSPGKLTEQQEIFCLLMAIIGALSFTIYTFYIEYRINQKKLADMAKETKEIIDEKEVFRQFIRETQSSAKELQNSLEKLSESYSQVKALDRIHSINAALNRWEQKIVAQLNKNIAKSIESKKTQSTEIVASVWQKKLADLAFSEMISHTLSSQERNFEDQVTTGNSGLYVNTREKIVIKLKELISAEKKTGAVDVKPIVYIITGMLPEEFYNGAQIEYSIGNSQPLILAHKWESGDYRDLYEESDKDIVERRCIIVRKKGLDAARAELYSALPTNEEFFEQKNLYLLANYEIRSTTLLQDQYKGVAERAMKYQNYPSVGAELMDASWINRNVHGASSFHFFPIVHINSWPSADNASERISLMESYVKLRHTSKKDALYCTIDELSVLKIKNAASYFAPGRVPEITLFGTIATENSAETIRWLFALKGKYRRFSSDMDIVFGKADLANAIIGDLGHLIFSETSASVGSGPREILGV